MTSSVFATCFIFSAGVLALWIDTRFPQLRPEALLETVICVAGAVLANALVPPLAARPLRENGLVLVTIFCVALPFLTAMFVAVLWAIRQLQATLAGRLR
jgi:hypothetical protein